MYLLQILHGQLNRRLVLELLDEPCCSFLPQPYLSDPVYLLQSKLLQAVDQITLGFLLVTDSSAFIKSYSVDLFIDVPDPVPLRETCDDLCPHWLIITPLPLYTPALQETHL